MFLTAALSSWLLGEPRQPPSAGASVKGQPPSPMTAAADGPKLFDSLADSPAPPTSPAAPLIVQAKPASPPPQARAQSEARLAAARPAVDRRAVVAPAAAPKARPQTAAKPPPPARPLREAARSGPSTPVKAPPSRPVVVSGRDSGWGIVRGPTPADRSSSR